MADVETARKRLLMVLGDAAEKYWNNMKLWYKQKISKDDFDTQAFQLLGPGNIHYHNDFLLSILARCHALATAPASLPPKQPPKSAAKSILVRKPKVKRPVEPIKVRLKHQFDPEDPYLSVLPAVDKEDSLQLKRETEEKADSLIIGEFGENRTLEYLSDEPDNKLCSHDLCLPDVATLHGRLFLGAWETGLDSVADDTAKLLSMAVEIHIKNVLSACLARRKPYQLRDGQFKHSFGTSQPKPTLRNIVRRASSRHRNRDEAEADALVVMASSRPHPVILSPISLFDLRDTLQIHRNVIPSHTVHDGNMQRILAGLWHPAHEEIEQNQLYKLETKRFHERLKQQRSLRA